MKKEKKLVEKISLNRVNQLVDARRRKMFWYSPRIIRGKFYSSMNPFLVGTSHLIEVHNLNKYFISKGKITHALKGVTFNIDQGDFVFIKGRSGSGKSTIMNALCGLVKPTSGDILVDNYNMAFLFDGAASLLRSNLYGFVFQEPSLIYTLTLKENIYLSLELSRKQRRGLTVRNPFDLVDLCNAVEIDPNLLNKYPYQISGGQLQRINLIRAMINNPKILLCDEPTSALDKPMTLLLLKFLDYINRTYLTTIVFITHDEALCHLGNKTIVVNDGIVESIELNNVRRFPTEGEL